MPHKLRDLLHPNRGVEVVEHKPDAGSDSAKGGGTDDCHGHEQPSMTMNNHEESVDNEVRCWRGLSGRLVP